MVKQQGRRNWVGGGGAGATGAMDPYFFSKQKTKLITIIVIS